MHKISKEQDFHVGIEVVDDAHDILFQLIDQARWIVEGKDLRSPSEINKSARYILNRLIDYTVSHFAEEEYLMEMHKTPGREAHKKSHRRLERSLMELYRRFRKDGVIILDELVEFLDMWWRKHILTMDKHDLEKVEDLDQHDQSKKARKREGKVQNDDFLEVS